MHGACHVARKVALLSVLIPIPCTTSNSALFCDTAAGKKKNVNVGSKGGSAGLDDYKYDTPLDDADEFM